MYISIIVPLYHGKKYIDDLIAQVEVCKRYLAENIKVELLLSNDAPDDSLDCLNKSKLIDVISINTGKNRGIHGARVRGLEYAKGEYVLFLDQDDKIEPDYLQSQLNKIVDADAVVCKAIHDKKPKYDAMLPFENVTSKEYMLKQGNPIVSPGQVLIRKSSISEVWKKNILTYNGADDWLLWICMMSEGKQFAKNDRILFEHVLDGENASWQSVNMMRSEQEIIHIIERNQVLSEEELNTLKLTAQNLNIQRIQLMDKFKKMFFIYNAWMDLYNRGCSVSQYLRKKGINSVAIYGNGYLGKQLYKELKRNGINVTYFIDRNALYMKEEIPVYSADEKLPEVDAVIITLTQGENEVISMLKKIFCTKYYSISELIKEAGTLS